MARGRWFCSRDKLERCWRGTHKVAEAVPVVAALLLAQRQTPPLERRRLLVKP
jgi:hypothetical protein